MILRPFLPQDLAAIDLQPGQRAELASIPDLGVHGETVYQHGPAFTGLSADGRVLGCAGLMINQPHWATAWAMLGEIGPHELLAATRAALAVLEVSSCRRIDAMVRADFEPGLRWAERLGFKMEGLMEAWAADGSDWWLCARVRRVG